MSKKYVLYMIFAGLSILVNIGTQFVVKIFLGYFNFFDLLIYPAKNISLLFLTQLIMGTGTGFLTKFILDKFIVFKEKHKNLAHTLYQMFIYGSFAIITTIIFWSFEISFKILFTMKNSEIIGGLIGLIIGYTVKYFLDKRMVFVKK